MLEERVAGSRVDALRVERLIEGAAQVDRLAVEQDSLEGLVAARFEIGRGVGPCRRTDVTALRVREHEQAGRARVVADFLEGTDPVRPERLEERELGLHADDVRRNRVDDPAAEARAAAGRGGPVVLDVADKLDRKQIRARVEPDQELRALALDGVCKPVAEQGRRDDWLGAHTSEATRAFGARKRAACAAL